MKGRAFIVGCPRSGTTLLQGLLASHPQIASFPESHFFPHAVPVKRWLKVLGISSPQAKERLHQFLHKIDHEEMMNLVPRYGFLIRQYVKSFVRILDELTIKQGKQHWVEKTPRHLHFIDIIEKYIPDPKFIHVIRNGKDVVASMYDVTHQYPEEWGGTRSIEQCVSRWNRDIKTTQRYITKKNHTSVKYEELVKKSEAVLKQTCEFFDVKFRPEMITKHGLALEKIILDHQEWIKSAKDRIQSANNRKFKTLFSEEEQSWITNHLNNPI